MDGQTTGEGGVTIDIHRIVEMIPHRYPFLLIDRLVDVIPGESAVGLKNVSVNEPFFQGHFPNRPVMPGVLIIEAMAQTAAVIVVASLGGSAEGKLVTSCRSITPAFANPWSLEISFILFAARNGSAATYGNLPVKPWWVTRSWLRQPTLP